MLLQSFYCSNVEDDYLIMIDEKKNDYYGELIKDKSNLEKKFGKRHVELLYGVSRARIR